MTAANSIVQNLRRLQDRHGYLKKDELRRLAELLQVPAHRVWEVASCFPQFRLPGANGEPNEPPLLTVQICRDFTCHLRGAAQLIESLKQFGEAQGYAKEDFAVEPVSCLGRCDCAPAARINEHNYNERNGPALKSPEETGRRLQQVITQSFEQESLPPPELEHELPAHQSPWKIDVYAGQPLERRYEAVRQFVTRYRRHEDLPVDKNGRYRIADIPLLKELTVSGLLGMGGAGAPAHNKWSDVLNASGGDADDYAKYVICNADESEPGTFKDREILLRAPHLVLEGVILGGLLVGATRGYIYFRHEYEEQIELMQQTIRRAEALRVCGERIMDSDWSFPVEVFVSPGGYICGEQTALIEAMEDKRAEPRNRPPEIATNGLWDKPTLLSNVETFAWVPFITLHGGAAYRDQGPNLRRGLRFFSISGHVQQPGVYEVPIGITLGQLIDDYAGGMLGGKALKACALSGPSGGFLSAKLPVEKGTGQRLLESASRLKENAKSIREGDDRDGMSDVRAEMMQIEAEMVERFAKENLSADATEVDVRQLPLDLILLRNHLELMLGAGIGIYAEGTDMISQAVNASEFYRNESCGKCVPCRLGSQQMVAIGTKIMNKECDLPWLESTRGDRAGLEQTMRDTSICGLGSVASEPVRTLLTYFQNDIRNHLR